MSEVGIDDETLELTLHSGECIRLCLNADAVRVVNGQGMELGKFVFDSSEGARNRITWRLIHMFLDGQGGAYKHLGIGTRAVRYFLWTNPGDDFGIPPCQCTPRQLPLRYY